MHTSLDGLMHLAGSLAASSFIIIASGDFITSSIDKIVQKVLVPINHPWAIKCVFCWGLLKEVYEDFRTFLDRISIYSRPRKVAPKVVKN